MDKESQSASSGSCRSQAGLLGVSGNHLGRAWMPAAQWLGMVVGTQEETAEAVDPSKQERVSKGFLSVSKQGSFMMMTERNLSTGGVSQITLDVTPDPPRILYVTSPWVSPVSLLTISFFAVK